jgi:hypothetical protein
VNSTVFWSSRPSAAVIAENEPATIMARAQLRTIKA